MGISRPHWNIYCNRPTVLRHTDLPPALGPEISMMRRSLVSVSVSGTISLPSLRNARSSSGWRALRNVSSPVVESIGIPAIISMAVSALARIKSIIIRKSAFSRRSSRYGRRKSLNSIRMRCISRCSSNCSSRTALLRLTTSMGSMNEVRPLADSSHTMPCSLRLSEAFTGISALPSRTTTSASSAVIPSAWAFFRMAAMVRAMDFSLALRSARICARAGEALSRTSPYLLMMESILRSISG